MTALHPSRAASRPVARSHGIRILIGTALLALNSCLWPSLHAADFARDIRPLLERHCVECHGPKKQKGELRLDVRASALKGGHDGPAVVAPGNSAASLGAVQNFGGFCGGTLAPTVTGFIVQETTRFAPALHTGAVIGVVAALLYFVLVREPITPRTPAAEPAAL